jgi:serine/threonine protein kinase
MSGMEIRHNRRRWIREVLNPPEIGILYTQNKGYFPGTQSTKQPSMLFVDLLNRSLGGVIIRTKWHIEPEVNFHLQIHNALEETWEMVKVRAKWTNSDSHQPGYNVIGVEFQPEAEPPRLPEEDRSGSGIMPHAADYEFFTNLPIFKTINRDALCSVLNSLKYKHVKAGRRLLKQGSRIDSCYFIQSGSCIVNVEDNGKIRPIDRIQAGGIAGEMAILDDHPLGFHVDAETDLELWALSRPDFDAICGDHPQLRNFLTHLLIDRFSPEKHTEKRKIGTYLITDMVGEGFHSLLYKGLHQPFNLPVSIKMIKHETALDSVFQENFHNEAQTIAGFNHENIISIHKIIERFRTVFLIMERWEGESLRSLLQRWIILPLPRVTDFLMQTCSGLDDAHRQGMVHRDISPANLVIMPGDRLKIVDFGLSLPDEGSNQKVSDSLQYKAPEQMEGRQPDQRTDVYAAGVVAFEMVTGKKPFPDDDLAAMAAKKLDPEFPDPSKWQPGLPEILRRFILKACAPQPAERFQNAHQALNHLQPLYDSYGLDRQNQIDKHRRIVTFSLRYSGKDQPALKKLLQEFSDKLKQLDAEIKAADIQDT